MTAAQEHPKKAYRITPGEGVDRDEDGCWIPKVGDPIDVIPFELGPPQVPTPFVVSPAALEQHPEDCPECRQGKHANCTGWALDADDEQTECGCAQGGHA